MQISVSDDKDLSRKTQIVSSPVLHFCPLWLKHDPAFGVSSYVVFLLCSSSRFALSSSVARQVTALWSWQMKRASTAVSKGSTANWCPDQTR